MEIFTGAAIICLAATVAIWANDHLPFKDADDQLLFDNIPSEK
jgi:hypothetical protein